MIKRILVTILAIFSLTSLAFAEANDGYEELVSEMSGDVFEGQKFSGVSDTIHYSDNNRWKSISDYEFDFDNEMLDEFDYFINKSVTSSKPVWIEYGQHEWYLVTKTSKVTYTDENDRSKTVSGWYAISEIFDNGVCLIGNKAYFFEDGVCANQGAAIKSDKGTIEFNNSTGKATKNYEIDVDIEQCNLPIYSKDDFEDGKIGVFDKESKESLYNGYWILDLGNDKYTLYHANSSGSSTAKKSNQSASTIYNYQKENNYYDKAIKDSPNSNKSNTNIKTDTTKTSNANTNITKSVTITDSNVKSYFKLEVKGGSLELVPKTGKVYKKSGIYYDRGKKKYFNVSNQGYVIQESTDKNAINSQSEVTEIVGSTVYKIGNNHILQGEE